LEEIYPDIVLELLNNAQLRLKKAREIKEQAKNVQIDSQDSDNLNESDGIQKLATHKSKNAAIFANTLKDIENNRSLSEIESITNESENSLDCGLLKSGDISFKTGEKKQKRLNSKKKLFLQSNSSSIISPLNIRTKPHGKLFRRQTYNNDCTDEMKSKLGELESLLQGMMEIMNKAPDGGIPHSLSGLSSSKTNSSTSLVVQSFHENDPLPPPTLQTSHFHINQFEKLTKKENEEVKKVEEQYPLNNAMTNKNKPKKEKENENENEKGIESESENENIKEKEKEDVKTKEMEKEKEGERTIVINRDNKLIVIKRKEEQNKSNSNDSEPNCLAPLNFSEVKDDKYVFFDFLNKNDPSFKISTPKFNYSLNQDPHS
jgi:hypothetical protein